MNQTEDAVVLADERRYESDENKYEEQKNGPRHPNRSLRWIGSHGLSLISTCGFARLFLRLRPFLGRVLCIANELWPFTDCKDHKNKRDKKSESDEGSACNEKVSGVMYLLAESGVANCGSGVALCSEGKLTTRMVEASRSKG